MLADVSADHAQVGALSHAPGDQRKANKRAVTPVVVRTRDDGVPIMPDALVIGTTAPAERIVRRLGAVLALSLGTLAAGEARAKLPAAIAALDAAPLVTLHAEGAQIYECKTDGDGKLLTDGDLRRTIVHAVLAALGD